LPPAAPAGAATGIIVCESRGYKYEYCDVDTQGRVRIVREVSTGNLCRKGWSWNFDKDGIWVDKGCRAEFEFGRGGGSSAGSNDAAIAAGILGALVLGAVIASSGTPGPAYVAPPPPPPVAYAPTPAWAIGSYQAWDPESRHTVQLIVQGNGRVTLRDQQGGVVIIGDLRDGLVYWSNGRRSWFAREGPGVMLGDVDIGGHYNFRRS
jgi:hypothetical protein